MVQRIAKEKERLDRDIDLLMVPGRCVGICENDVTKIPHEWYVLVIRIYFQLAIRVCDDFCLCTYTSQAKVTFEPNVTEDAYGFKAQKKRCYMLS